MKKVSKLKNYLSHTYNCAKYEKHKEINIEFLIFIMIIIYVLVD